MWGVEALAVLRSWKAASLRRRVLFWPVVLTLICGLIEFGAPVERYIEILHDQVRSHHSDGATAVVMIDSRSVTATPAWPSKRAVEAELTDTLFALGAKRVIFDRAFADPSPANDDAVFAASLARHPGRVVLGARFERERQTGRLEALLPTPQLRKAAAIGSYNVWRDWMGYTSQIPYRSEIGGNFYPSFAAILANRDSNHDGLFEPDFSIEWRTIPAVSMIDVLRRTPAAKIVAGRDVIVGTTADSLGDTHTIPRQGPIPGVFIHAIAGETLRVGDPIELGWIPFYAAAVVLSIGYVRLAKRRSRAGLATTSFAAMAVVPAILDYWNIEADIMPALLLLGAVTIRAGLIARRAINPATGLPTFDAALHHGASTPATLVGVKLRNYSDLRLTLVDQQERALLAEVVRRLRVAGDVDDLMHVDDTFVWSSPLAVSQVLFDHVEGLHAILSAPIDLGHRRIDLAFAFGIDGERDRPLSNRIGGVQHSADLAATSGIKWSVNDPRAVDDVSFRLSLPSQIQGAIEAGHLWVAYQPKMDLRKNRICGAEALVRWTHPERGMIRPDEFIPAVEEANRIDALTYFVLETAIRDVRQLDQIDPTFTVAVNLSVRMLEVDGLANRVALLLKRYGVSPLRLTLEITESFQVDSGSGALATLCALRATGIGISIDDYGTKFSTLEYVRQLPASEIKIDQQFARHVHVNEQDAIMVGSTIKLAHDLGLQVVAEGVEEAGSYAKLASLGCDVIQGYIVARPQSFDSLLRFLGSEREKHRRFG